MRETIAAQGPCRCHGEACDVAVGGAAEAVVDAAGVQRSVEVGAGGQTEILELNLK